MYNTSYSLPFCPLLLFLFHAITLQPSNLSYLYSHLPQKHYTFTKISINSFHTSYTIYIHGCNVVLTSFNTYLSTITLHQIPRLHSILPSYSLSLSAVSVLKYATHEQYNFLTLVFLSLHTFHIQLSLLAASPTVTLNTFNHLILMLSTQQLTSFSITPPITHTHTLHNHTLVVFGPLEPRRLAVSV